MAAGRPARRVGASGLTHAGDLLFGHLVVPALLPLVRLPGRLAPGASRAWARPLDTATRPFDVIGYWGSPS
ncbi:hypothetical protein AB0D86_32495 [Streptomyces sp. NPDC048324]|uniref:hypothetical protein n=1 Tax=Streptomyces sp. NPDC048324 TaxID=3157205 RepID=UPI00341C5D07